jgi:hypothetical protein
VPALFIYEINPSRKAKFLGTPILRISELVLNNNTYNTHQHSRLYLHSITDSIHRLNVVTRSESGTLFAARQAYVTGRSAAYSCPIYTMLLSDNRLALNPSEWIETLNFYGRLKLCLQSDVIVTTNRSRRFKCLDVTETANRAEGLSNMPWRCMGEWSASCPGCFTTRERAPGTQWIGGWVGLRACLDDMEKRKFLTLPGLELWPFSCPPCSQSLYPLCYRIKTNF